jgi:very-short-patch-repair endonuclease
MRGAGHKGSGNLASLLDGIDGTAPSDSRLEVKVARLLRGSVAPFVQQYEVRVFGRRFRLDFAWPEQRVTLECDGRGSHLNRRSFQRDRAKWTALGASGWRVLVVTWEDATERPQTVTARVEAALAQ